MAIKIVVIGLAAALAAALLWFYTIPKAVVAVNSDLDDPCGTVSRVLSENTGLHIKPSKMSRKIEKLLPPTTVNVCIEVGAWSGVIVPFDKIACEISDNITTSGIYMGKCQTGWIRTEYLKLIAG